MFSSMYTSLNLHILWCVNLYYMIVNCRHTEDSHVKTNIIHTLFRVQKYGLMPLKQYQDILTPSNIKRCKKSQNTKKTWYSLNLHVFTNFIFQVRSLYYSLVLLTEISFHIKHVAAQVFLYMSLSICLALLSRNRLWWIAFQNLNAYPSCSLLLSKHNM